MTNERHAMNKRSAPARGMSASSEGGKTLAHLQAEAMAEKRFTEMMAAQGVPHSQIALQVLYYLPKDFLDAYMEVWREALGGDDGGSGERGRTNQATAELGRAAAKTYGGRGRKFKKYWTVRDERVLELKEKADKRLRAIGRDLRYELEELHLTGKVEGGGRGEGKGSAETAAAGPPRCDACGILVAAMWTFCPKCGNAIAD